MPQSSPATIRIGTRGSALALWQANTVRELIQAAHPDAAADLVIIKPEGDLDKHSSLRQIGGRGVFTSALQQRMLANEIDIAVHSTKDLPSLAPYGLGIAAYPQREDARDALVSRHGVGLEELPTNPIIGTSSRRRAAQILQIRPDAEIRELRGNIDTRLKKGLSDEFDAVILAAAGLKRMDWDDRITALLPVDVSCPAPGQGALAVESRVDDEPVWSIAASLDNRDIRTAVSVERAFLRGVGGGCSTPIGAHVQIERMHGIATARFWAMLGSDDGSRLERFYAEWPATQAMDRAFIVAYEMMRAVAPNWTGVSIGNPLADRHILVTGSASQIERMSTELKPTGAQVCALPTITIQTHTVDVPTDADWIVLTSKHAVPSVDWTRVTAPVAVVGEATATALRAVGVEPGLVAAGPGGEQLAKELIDGVKAHVGVDLAAASIDPDIRPQALGLTPISIGSAPTESGDGLCSKHIVAIASDIARPELAAALAAAGARVTTLIGYVNTPVTTMDDDLRSRIAVGQMEAVTFASPSSAAAFVQMIGIDLPALSGAAMIAIGPTTARAMVEQNLPVHATAEESTAQGVVATLIHYFGGEAPQL
ncbi:MAG: hydroxymethylbilane synthase [Thermomicrobiales bacterium]|nr:hydroxymethylbilane synthase [Thermomicrobiales bacterium]